MDLSFNSECTQAPMQHFSVCAINEESFNILKNGNILKILATELLNTCLDTQNTVIDKLNAFKNVLQI